MSVQEDTEFEWDLRDDLFAAIARYESSDDRSMQSEIGPSGFGTPCVRKLGYRLAQIPSLKVTDPGDVDQLVSATKWRAAVGRALHLKMQTMLEQLNDREASSPMHTEGIEPCRASWCDQNGKTVKQHKYRYLVEFDVTVGTLNSERPITGHVDFYDRLRKVVGDWKFPGPGALKKYHAACGRDEDPHPSKEYREQAHIYGRGVQHSLGLEVERIAVIFVPMNGELRDGFVWSEKFKPDIAVESFRRARTVAEKLRVAKLEDDDPETSGSDGRQLDRALAKLKTAPDYCHSCDWFKAGAEFGTTTGCPGDPSIFVDGGGAKGNAALQQLMEDD